jgi:CubicO group peptidase (beta-lactamase class C family)
MKLHDEGKFNLDAELKDYWPEFKRSNKANIDFRHILAHHGRLKAWIPYWMNTVKKDGGFKPRTFKPDSSENYPMKVANNLYLYKNYRKKINKAIKKSPLDEKEGYLYSGLSFYLYPTIIEKIVGKDYEQHLKETFYRPLGAYTLTYNAYKHFPIERLVPTEKDTFFRMEQIHGWVHDEGAAMMGGISGNAGLFGSANDLAKLMQMYLQMGKYGDKRYISSPTLTKFTMCQFCEEGNRRGLGFDKPLIENKERGYAAVDASSRSFGHSGYTGTMAWADPEYNLLFIFFSNRVYPTRLNTKLYQMDVRSRIHQIIYDEFLK